MPDIAIQIDTTADPAAAYAALTTTDGVAGWWTTRNQTSGAVGEVDRMWFPDAPMAWELRGDEMFRIVTLGWAQMLLQLRQYLDSGQPASFFSFQPTIRSPYGSLLLPLYEQDGRSHPVYRAGGGPAVIVIHEIPGIHPGMVSFAQRLLQAGYTVYLPSLFGRPGQHPSTGAVLGSILWVCVTREFAILADRTSPVVTWLRALAATAYRDCGGPGVGAIGMCLTGGFALAMAVDPAVLAPVVSQPGLPAPLTARKRAAVGLDPADLAQVKARTERGLGVLGLRFSADRGCPAERFQRLRRELGEAFEAIEVDSSSGNPYGIPQRAHAVLTVDLVDAPGHPTRAALDRVLEFLGQRLRR